jgi:hypothetical protein
MKLSEIPRKRLSKQEINTLFDELVKNLKVRPESDRRAFGWPLKSLLSHIRWLEGEIDRITQEKFTLSNSDQPAIVPDVKPSNLSVGRVTHAFPPSPEKVYSTSGQRAYEAFEQGEDSVNGLLRWGKIKDRDQLKAHANEWADKNKKELLK